MSDDNRWTSDAGSVLIETLVSAVVIAVVVLGVFASLDASSRSSGREKARSVAMSLAEKDQERLRGMRVTQLAALQAPAASTVLVSGVSYTVESEAQWLRDAGGTPSCTNDTQQADYLKVRSTVTSEVVGDKTPPVTLRSTVNPPVAFGPDLGTLAVKVVNRSGLGVPNISVAAGSLSETTNAAGCALFDFIRQGAYDITLNQPGWVNFAGETVAVTRGVQVNAGKVNVVSTTYDRAGTVDVSFATQQTTGSGEEEEEEECEEEEEEEEECSTTTQMIADSGQVVSVAHPSLPAGVRLFTDRNANGSIRAGSLFPFTSPYAVYSGQCATQNPERYIANYFAEKPGRLQVAPATGYAVTVVEPALKVTLKRANDVVPRTDARVVENTRVNVVVTHTANGCTDQIVFAGNATNASSQVYPKSESDAAKRGTLKLPGIPFGDYTVCADDGVRRVTTTNPVQNRAVVGTAAFTLTIPNTGATTAPSYGTCPRL